MDDGRQRPGSGGWRWRVLSLLLPRWYRERYGDGLLEIHRDAAGGGEGAGGVAFWAYLTWDVLLTAVQTRAGRGGEAGAAGAGRGEARIETGGDGMSIRDEVRNAGITARSLLKRPGFVAAAVVTLGLGIGAATAIFSLVYGALLRPLPYESPDELVQVRDLYQPTGGSGGMSSANFFDLRREARTLASFSAWQSRSFNLATETSPERVRGMSASAGILTTLGVRPVVGRGFAEGEDRAGAPRVALVSHRIWHERFDGDGDVLGSTLSLGGEPYEIVGVLPEDFWFPGAPEVVTAFAWDEASLTRGNRAYEGVARLGPDVTIETAEAELRSVYDRLREEYPGPNDGWTVRAIPLEHWAIGTGFRSYWLIGAAALLVLLIGCVNVANLLLVRAERRHGEMAVRAAMGAGRGRIVRLFVEESMILTFAASVVGVLVAWLGTGALVSLYGPSLPRSEQVGINLPVLGFALATSALVGLAVGVVPALRMDARKLYSALREGGGAGGGTGGMLQRGLVASEIALAVLLAAGAALLLNSSARLNRIDLGVDIDNVLAFQVEAAGGAYQDPASVTEFFRRAVAGMERLPGVAAVGITDRVPLLGGYNITTLASPRDPDLTASFVEIRRVTPGFFPAAGLPLVRGRLLSEADGRAEAPVVVISDALAETIFPDGDAVGQWVNPGWNEDGFEVVGVVGSVREWGVLGERRPALYWPYPVPNANPGMVFVVRTEGPPMAMLPEIRRAVHEVDPTLPLYGVTTLEEAAHRTLGSRRLATNLFTTFGVLALLLAAVGIFGVLAHAVEQRTREIGIRIAMGASQRGVVRLVLRQGLKLVGIGLVVGMAGAVASGRLIGELLYEVEPDDVLTLSAVALTVVGAALAAIWLPARRASRVEPSEALRSD